LEESIANALYHRSWEIREPVVIRILPDCIEIINQGGPDRSVKMDEILKGVIRNKRYRNRRIGDFLKELDMTEGRGTGIPIIRREMKKNGSPEPRFETDDNYSYFIATLPIHPAFLSDEGVSEGVNGAINKSEDIGQSYDNKCYNLIDEISGVKGGALNDGINGALNKAIIFELVRVIKTIYNHKGANRITIIDKIGKGNTTLERYLKILKNYDLIEYQGSKKTGGYHLTEKAQNKLK